MRRSGKQDNLSMSSCNVGRRGFLGSIGAGALVALAPGVTFIRFAKARSANEPVTDTHHWGMLIDSNKCAQGCNACVSACREENGLIGYDRPHTDVQWIRKVTLEDKRSERKSSFPVMCQHCQHPPCVDVCPTGASFRRADGVVLVDRHICIGCRYCMMACPYKARSFAHEAISNQKAHAPRGKGTVEACTMCVHRIDEDPNLVPACVEVCSAQGKGAMVFGDMNDPNSQISMDLKSYSSTELRSDLKLDPGVRYRNV